MKRIFAILLFYFFTLNTQAAELVLSYYISNRSIDSTLDSGKGMFVFMFYAPNGLPAQGNISVTIDNCTMSLPADANGKVHVAASTGKHLIYFSTYHYEEIKTDTIAMADQEKIELTVNFDKDDEPRPMKKPVIYVYAQDETNMKISLDLHGYPLLFAYPEYTSEWNFVAKPGGEIEMDGKLFNYIFWEGGNCNNVFKNVNKKEGYCVSQDNLLVFMESSLDKMGFNSKEKQDFITFWYPQMKDNPFNYIHFMFNDECNVFANLACNPQPANVYRMSMLWTNVDAAMYNIQAQVFPVINRNGLTLIEWGGGNIKEETVLTTVE